MSLGDLVLLKKPTSVLLIVALLLQVSIFVFIAHTPETKAAPTVIATPAVASWVTEEEATADNTVTVPAIEGLAIGDLIVACVSTDKAGDESTTDMLGWPTGFTPVINEVTNTEDDLGSLVAYKIVDATSTESTYEFSYHDVNADFTVVMASFRGVDTVDPFDATSTSQGTNWDDTTDSNPSVTTTNDNALVVLCLHHTNNNITAYTPPSGSKLVSERKASGENVAMAYFVEATAGATGAQQFVTTGEGGGEEWHTNTIAFNAQQSFTNKTVYQLSGPASTTWTVPDNVYELEIKAWGAGGAGGKADSDSVQVAGGHGGGGAFVYGRLEVTPGETLYLEVGGGGATGTSDTSSGDGGGGGGHTLVQRSSENLIIAGGGGGGGGSSNGSSEDGGDGGAAGADQGEPGDNGDNSQSAGGRPGDQAGGGAAYNGGDGSSLQGGDGQGAGARCESTTGGGGSGGLFGGGDGGLKLNSSSCGGGGGGGSGYYGGEGGEIGNDGIQGAGGGGGSSFASTTVVSTIVKRSGKGRTVANGTDYDLQASDSPDAGVGGWGENRESGSYGAIVNDTNHLATDGHDGLVIIKYRPLTIASGKTIIRRDLSVTGDADVFRNIAKAAGTFVIDHPLDPQNKLLYHSFVEAPEALNVYDGVVELDWNGRAEVTLPHYFEALNVDYRYLYTPLGEPMPNLHVEQEVEDNQFWLAGGAPGGRVAWQVTGVRNDPYIQANPIVVEVNKGPDAIIERGEYLFKDYETLYE